METTHDKEMHMKTRNLFSGILMMAMVAGAAGSVTTKLAPPPGASCTDTAPLCAATSSRTTASPIPLPEIPASTARSSRRNGSHTRA